MHSTRQQFPRAQLPTRRPCHYHPRPPSSLPFQLQTLIRMAWTLDQSPKQNGNQDQDDDTATCSSYDGHSNYHFQIMAQLSFTRSCKFFEMSFSFLLQTPCSAFIGSFCFHAKKIIYVIFLWYSYHINIYDIIYSQHCIFNKYL